MRKVHFAISPFAIAYVATFARLLGLDVLIERTSVAIATVQVSLEFVTVFEYPN